MCFIQNDAHKKAKHGFTPTSLCLEVSPGSGNTDISVKKNS